MAGRLVYQGKEFFEEFTIRNGDSLEYYPLTETGNFGWNLKISEDGSRAIAEVQNERPGTFSLKNNIVWRRKWFLEHNIIWKELDWCVDPVKAEIFHAELQARGIKYGIVPDFWNKILAVQGSAEVLIAEQTPPIPPINAHIIDFEDGLESKQQITDIVDYYASKIITCEKDDVIARKIPGREGRPGRDIFGNELPVYEMVDLQLKAGPNTYLSADGLEVRAKFHGTPIKLNKYTYSVEEIFYLDQDVDLETGSIEFPGDVIITKNVEDGFHVYSDRRIQIKGLVSGADLKAEDGIDISNSVFNSHIIVGEKHVIRTQFIRNLQELADKLDLLLEQLNKLEDYKCNTRIPYNYIFRIVVERKFRDLPSLVLRLCELTNHEDESFYTRQILIAVHTLKYFIIDNYFSKLKDDRYLVASLQEIKEFLSKKRNIKPEKAAIVAGYVQNSDIISSGDFLCRNDVYNSTIKAEGEINIRGACRASKLEAGSRIYVYELGSQGVGTDTIIKLPVNGCLTAEYCYPNVKVIIGKECVPIDQTVRKLDVYIENGTLWVDKLKWLGL